MIWCFSSGSEQGQHQVKPARGEDRMFERRSAASEVKRQSEQRDGGLSAWLSSSSSDEAPIAADDVWGPPLHQKQLRVVVCKESSLQGHALLFDTHTPSSRGRGGRGRGAGRGAPSGPGRPAAAEETRPTALERDVPSAGTLNPALLGELMFGALPLSFIGTATKVHMVDNSEHIFVTKMFRHFVPKMDALRQQLQQQQQQQQQEQEQQSSEKKPPRRRNRSMSTWSGRAPAMGGHEAASERSDGVSLLFKSAGIVDGASSTSAAVSSADIPHSSALKELAGVGGVVGGQSGLNPSASSSLLLMRHDGGGGGGEAPGTTPGDWVSLAVGVVVSIGSGPVADLLQAMISSHFLLVDHHLGRLTHAIHHALVKYLLHLSSVALQHGADQAPQTFTKYCLQPSVSLQTSAAEFLDTIRQLVMAPRLKQPLWLAITSFPSDRRALLRVFLSNLAALYDRYETATIGKPSRFLSTLLTAFLSSNTSWLASIPRQSTFVASSPSSHRRRVKSNASHPLLHQLCDLHGIRSGQPDQRLTKVVVVGRDRTLVRQLLYVLSYFLRCRSVLINQLPVNVQSFLNPALAPASDAATAPIVISGSQPDTDSGSGEAGAEYLLERVPVVKGMSAAPATHIYQPQLASTSRDTFASTTRISSTTRSSTTATAATATTTTTTTTTTATMTEGEAERELVRNLYYFTSFGPSLQASMCCKYASNYVTMGVAQRSFDKELALDLKRYLRTPLSAAQPALQSAACIVADTNLVSCEIVECHADSAEPAVHPCAPSLLIGGMLAECVQCWRLGMPIEFCVMQIEDRLRELLLYGELLNSAADEDPVVALKAVSTQEFCPSDIKLLRSIAQALRFYSIDSI